MKSVTDDDDLISETMRKLLKETETVFVQKKKLRIIFTFKSEDEIVRNLMF